MKLPPGQRYAAVALCYGLGLFVFIKGLCLPAWLQWHQAHAQWQQLHEQITGLEQQLSQEANYLAAIADHQQSINVWQERLLKEQAMPHYFAALSEAAVKQGLRVRDVDVLPAQAFVGFYSRPMTLSFSGHYTGLLAWLTRLHDSPITTRVEQITLVHDQGVLLMDLLLHVFYQTA